MPDSTAPTITSIEQSGSDTDGWNTEGMLTISGEEDYASAVTLSLTDREGNVYLDGAAADVTDGKWSYSFLPDIEADEETEFTLTAKDTIGNTSTKAFTVKKTDHRAPAVATVSDVDGSWSTEKTITLSAADEGSGDLSVSFGSADSYTPMEKDGTAYTKEVTLTGDAYADTPVAVYYKDAAGNTTVQSITVSGLDNTAPTVTGKAEKADGGKQEITITADDYNAALDAEGSGVAYYAAMKDGQEPGKDDWQESSTFTLPYGRYRLYAMDKAGNIGKSAQLCGIGYADSTGSFTAQETDTEGTYDADVSMEVKSSFTVRIPKSITLSGTTKSGTYTVTVTGDIAGTEQVTVTPEESFTMKSAGKKDVKASVVQEADTWSYDTTEGTILTQVDGKGSSSATGTITAEGTSAGYWEGTLKFTVTLKETAAN
jgi:hypothetical protein